MSCALLTPVALGALARTAASSSRNRPVRGAHHNLNNNNVQRSVVRLSLRPSGSRSSSRGSLNVRAASWWENLPLPPTMKRGAKEIEYFQGNPLEQVLPWMSSPKATTPGRPDPKDAERSLVLFDFGAGSPDSDSDRFGKVWGELNDVIMGGQSEGGASIISIPDADGGKCAKLSGVVMAQNGGFVSMRTRNFSKPVDLAPYDGVKLRVRGDGFRYKFILRDDENFFALAYHSAFNTVEGEWMDVEIPFEDFTPVLRGEVVKNGESEWRDIRRGSIYSLQIMLSKFELGMSQLNPSFAAGPFSLEVSNIKAVKMERAIVSARQDAGGSSSSA
eukprot:CAMPEP_0197591252 /NCGR_PEP_ID=MMETSP1326-20131121/12969_1 /TAXON_ID=1155430 /ORGANISM="Genus nov. species nov., Strain RCC2288" /LENGTH=331 /DNA_ID=CAMNT_0043156647 /DNA_START=68 /DNA_END=1063 /DNA_ORIENTATION=+